MEMMEQAVVNRESSMEKCSHPPQTLAFMGVDAGVNCPGLHM